MRLFDAHFGDQADISQPETLFRLARDAGLDVDRLAHACMGETLRRTVLEDWAEAIAWFGVSSLPTVIFDERLAHVGVRTLEEYAHVLEHLSGSL
jgi:predicted DsbA family dithiol-disulfide isomerase